MSTDLPVTFNCRGSLEQVHAFDYRVCPIFFADFEHSTLDPALPIQGVIVGKEA